MQSPNSQNCSCGAFLLLIEACSPKNYCSMLLQMPASDNPSNDAEPQFAKLLLRSVPFAHCGLLAKELLFYALTDASI